jgi:TolB protein
MNASPMNGRHRRAAWRRLIVGVVLILACGCNPAASKAPSSADASPASSQSASAPSPAPSPSTRGTPGTANLGMCLPGSLPAGRIAFTVGDNQDNGIGVVNTDGSGFRILVPAKHIENQPSGGTEAPRWLSADRLGFDSNRNGGPDDWHLFIVDPNGGEPKQLTKGPDGIEGYISLSRDGSLIVFAKWLPTGDPKEPWGPGGIFVADPDGKHERLVTRTPEGGYDDWPDISPDGKQIAFNRQDVGEAGGLMVVNVDGTGLKQLIPDSVQPERPRWSNDGRKILFHNNRHRHDAKSTNVWVMNPDGSDLRQLTFEDRDGQAFYPAWSPDDQFIVFTHHRPSSPTNDLAVFPSAGGASCTLWNGRRDVLAWDSDWGPPAT